MALMGFGTGMAGPSRDMLVRQATTSTLGPEALGRVYGFVYSGLDSGFAIAPLVIGPVMDAGHFTVAMVAVAVFQAMAIFTAMTVGAHGHGVVKPPAVARS